MASVRPRPSEYEAARSMFQLMLVHVRARSTEPDLGTLRSILDAALDDPRDGEIVRHYLAAYLARCLQRSTPDHTVWEPWRANSLPV